MRAPTLDEIHAAELRVAQSKQTTRDTLRRVRVAFRAALARPSTLALVAGAAGLLGFWLARRPQMVSGADGGAVATRASAAGSVALGFIVRYAIRHLPFILSHVGGGQKSGVAGPSRSVDPDRRVSPFTEPSNAEA